MEDKNILIKFTNGDWFEIPLKAIAEHRANFYHLNSEPNHENWQGEVDYILDTAFEGLHWLQNNMEWEDIYPLGIFINAEFFDYSKGMVDAGFEVLKK